MTDSIQMSGLTCVHMTGTVLRGPGNPLLSPHPPSLRHLRAEPVGHELKVAIWRDEGDGAVVVKARQPHALVEFHVLQLYGLVLAA